ncbi:unnamed protein product [Rotaria sordida]|uniref:Glycine-rich domain-containing protein-like n=1 Tax=Rotaria sordida TaxID=392033 RepID=A0A815TLB9_9BILA|nr:unnamed protein product [Rotaria sordida]CAF4173435.1 unnamed protein product [Rotaria sordida]
MDADEGEGWSHEQVNEIVPEYRKFLLLTKMYENQAVVPSKLVDKVWHYHILDTQAYAVDCENVFGRFLHHYPYWGMRGESDLKSLQDAFSMTLQLYEKEFGPAPENIWRTESRCPKCGRR